MTIERWGEFFTLSCDWCSFTDELEEDEFMEVVEYAREQGWYYKGDGAHKCPDCIAKEKADEVRDLEDEI